MHLNGENALGTIGLQVDLHRSRRPTCRDQSVAQFFQSVAAVGDQLPDEHLVRGGRGSESARDNELKRQLEISYSTNPVTSFSEYKDLATMSSSFFVSA